MPDVTQFHGVMREEEPVPITNIPQYSSPLVEDVFPEEWKDDFEGLTYLGYLEEKVEIPYHTFIVHTLTIGEKLEVTRVTREFENFIGYNRAYKAAVVAAALKTVDGKPLILANKAKSSVREKYEYVINAWYDPIIDKLYEAINNLELREVKVMYEVGVINLPPVDATAIANAVEQAKSKA